MIFLGPHFEDREAVREELASLHDEPSFMSPDVVHDTFLLIIDTVVIISSIHYILTTLLRPYSTKEKDDEHHHLAYLTTNFLVNLVLGVFGLYHMIFTVPDISSLTEVERVAGFDQYLFFGIIQIGFNLWGLVIGIFVVHERPSMVAHHVAAMSVASMSVFFNAGFRYFTPFFFGAIEISSVPLALINFFKRNKEWTKQNYPTVSTVVKLVFAVSFIILRVYLWTPLMYDVLQLASLLVSTCDSISCQFVVGGFWTCGVFLTILQYFWSFLIVKGLISFATARSYSPVTGGK